MPMPCIHCGTILPVPADAEFTYCTTCGGRIDLGVHSYRTESSIETKVICKTCFQLLDKDMPGTIYSCGSCGDILCSICANVHETIRYCDKCFNELHWKLDKKKKDNIMKSGKKKKDNKKKDKKKEGKIRKDQKTRIKQGSKNT